MIESRSPCEQSYGATALSHLPKPTANADVLVGTLMEIGVSWGTERRIASRRQSKRYRFSAEAVIRQLETGLLLPGTLLDLSVSGCLLRLNDASLLETGSSVDLSVSSNAITFRALGSVRHYSLTMRLLGMSFTGLNRRGQIDLGELIADLELHRHRLRSESADSNDRSTDSR